MITTAKTEIKYYNNRNKTRIKTKAKMKPIISLTLIITFLSNLFNLTNAETGTLLDTREETFALNWPSLVTTTGQGWMESSSSDSDYRKLMVCDINEKNPDNWIRSHFIKNPKNANTIYIELSFSVRTCKDVRNVKICREAFTLFLLEDDQSEEDLNLNQFSQGTTNRPKSVILNRSDMDQYARVDTIAAQDRFVPQGQHSKSNNRRDSTHTTVKTISYNLENQTNQNSGFYLALRDTGGCISLDYIAVHYKYCPQATFNFVNYPETMAGESSLVPAKGSCVDNAVIPKGSARYPHKYCNHDGQWWMSLDDKWCHCEAGFEGDNNNQCLPCTENFYKKDSGLATCNRCPLNSSTLDKRQSKICSCNDQYYRAEDDSVDDKCTRPPGEVDHLKGKVEGTSVNITWSPPADNGGRSYDDIKYQIKCFTQICDKIPVDDDDNNKNNDDNQPTNSKKARYLRSQRLCRFKIIPHCSVMDHNYVNHRKFIISNLTPNTIYQFRIFAYNSVSKLAQTQDGFLPKFRSIRIHTEKLVEIENTPATPRIEVNIDRDSDLSQDFSETTSSEKDFIGVGFGNFLEGLKEKKITNHPNHTFIKCIEIHKNL